MYDINSTAKIKIAVKNHDPRSIKRLMTDFEYSGNRMSVLESLSKISENSDLYTNKPLIRFLKSVSITTDKYETIQLVYIINNILMRSCEQNDENYDLTKDYFTKYLKRVFSSTDEQCIYSYLNIRTVIQRLYEKEKVCKLNWSRIINFINDKNFYDQSVWKK